MTRKWDPVAGVFIDDSVHPSRGNPHTTDSFVPSLGTSPLDFPEDGDDDTGTKSVPVVSSRPVPEIGS